MYSLAFPDMFTSSRTKLFKDHAASASNLRLLLGSDKYSLLGDPEFGTNVKKVIYSNNSVILKDIIIDDIYTAILMFMPQLQLTRKNIQIYQREAYIAAVVQVLNKIDYVLDTYEIRLTDTDKL